MLAACKIQKKESTFDYMTCESPSIGSWKEAHRHVSISQQNAHFEGESIKGIAKRFDFPLNIVWFVLIVVEDLDNWFTCKTCDTLYWQWYIT